MLRVEGRVIGPWVGEFREAWRVLADSLGGKKLFVDLRGVTYMDTSARQVLAKMYEQTGAEFLANTPMTSYFVQEAQRAGKKNA